MIIREEIIRDALRHASPRDLDDVLAVIEAYRMCAGAASRPGAEELGSQQTQVRECAERIESVLAEFAATGVLALVPPPFTGFRPVSASRRKLPLEWAHRQV